MKITNIHTTHMRNDEHFQFYTEVRDLISKHGAAALKIQAQFETFLVLYDEVDEGIKKINKSAITAEIHKADKARDEIWSGINSMNKAALKHFDPEVQKAAQRLKIVFDTYGNIAKKPLDEQTSAVYNILQDLQGKYAADVAKVGIEQWVTELQARNIAFGALVKDRFDETALRTDVVLKEARAALDTAYRIIIERINAFMLLEGAAEYEHFIRALNAIVDHYADTLARRTGKKKSSEQ